MIARTLSRMPPNACTLLAVSWLLAADTGWGQPNIRVSSAPSTVANPFATGGPTVETVAVEPERSRRGPTIYQNPFATMSSAPPFEIPMLPGPVSRWRRRGDALGDYSPVKTAILSSDPIERTRIPWDQLPPVERLQPRAATTQSEADSPADGNHGEPPDPIRFAAAPLNQPNWLAPPPTASLRPLPPPSTATPLDSTSTMRDSAESLAGPALGSAAPANDGAGETPFDAPLQWGPGTPDSEVVIVSDYSQSSESRLADAQRLAQTAESVDQFSAVIDTCQHGLAEGPPTPLAAALRRLAAWAYNRRGELLIESDQQPEALHDFQVAISLDPHCALAIHNRAVTLAQQNEPAEALRDFNRVIELNPGLATAYRNRAELLASLGRIVEAVRDYTRAIDGLPDDAELYCARAAAWQRMGDHARALADLDQAIRLAPDRPGAFTQRGNIAAEQGNYDQGLSDFRRALAIDASWAEAYRSLAWLQATCPNPRYRDPEQAIDAAQQALQHSPPDDCFVLEALAAAHASGGRFDEAVEFQKQAIAVAPPDFAEPLRQRLALYQQRQPFLNELPPGPRAALRP